MKIIKDINLRFSFYFSLVVFVLLSMLLITTSSGLLLDNKIQYYYILTVIILSLMTVLYIRRFGKKNDFKDKVKTIFLSSITTDIILACILVLQCIINLSVMFFVLLLSLSNLISLISIFYIYRLYKVMSLKEE